MAFYRGGNHYTNRDPNDYTKDEVFNLYQLRELVGQDWEEQKTTYCVVQLCTTGQVFRFVNDWHGHAEEHMIQSMTKHFAKTEKEEMFIYIVNAPCGPDNNDCASQLQQFQEDLGEEITIIAVSAYYCNEPQLRAMISTAKIRLCCFDKGDWMDLRKILEKENELDGELDEELDEEWQYTRAMSQRDAATALKFKKL